jgi:antitoxin component YwqK of YwqJK toxin-antitoxin module
MKHGDWFIWSSTGKPLYELHYSLGEKIGTWKIYDESGKLISERKY